MCEDQLWWIKHFHQVLILHAPLQAVVFKCKDYLKTKNTPKTYIFFRGANTILYKVKGKKIAEINSKILCHPNKKPHLSNCQKY